MPATLVVKKAWPALLVTAVPTVVPFKENVTVLPEINPPLDFFCNVALRIARLRSEEHTSELQSRSDLGCRLLLEKKKKRWGGWGVGLRGKREDGGMVGWGVG